MPSSRPGAVLRSARRPSDRSTLGAIGELDRLVARGVLRAEETYPVGLGELATQNRPMWAKAKGPINATMCTIRSINWQLMSPTRWLAHEAIAYDDGPRFAKAQILGQAAKDLEKGYGKAQPSMHAGEVSRKEAAWNLIGRPKATCRQPDFTPRPGQSTNS